MDVLRFAVAALMIAGPLGAQEINDAVLDGVSKLGRTFSLFCPDSQTLIDQANCYAEAGEIRFFISCGVFYDDSEERLSCYDRVFSDWADEREE